MILWFKPWFSCNIKAGIVLKEQRSSLGCVLVALCRVLAASNLAHLLSACNTPACIPDLRSIYKLNSEKKKRLKKKIIFHITDSVLQKNLYMLLAASVPTWGRAYPRVIYYACACRSAGQPSVLPSKWQIFKKQLPPCTSLCTITQAKGREAS